MCVHPTGRRPFVGRMNPEGGGRSRPPSESPPAGRRRTRGGSRGREQKKIGLPVLLARSFCAGGRCLRWRWSQGAKVRLEEEKTSAAGGWGEPPSGVFPRGQGSGRAARPDGCGARQPRARPEGHTRSPSTHPGGAMAGGAARTGAPTRAISHGPLARGRAGFSPSGPAPTLPTKSGRRTRRRARWNRPSRSPGRRPLNAGALRPYSAQPSSRLDGGLASGLEPRNSFAQEGRSAFSSFIFSPPRSTARDLSR